jgi:hypothetical protein
MKLVLKHALIALVFSTFLLQTGCGIRKKRKDKLAKTEAAETLLNFNKKQYDYEDISLTYKVDFTSAAMSGSAKLFMKIRKDSAVWGSVYALGLFEAARIYADPDTAMMLMKTKEIAYLGNYNYLKSIVKADVSLGQLQQIIMGNSLFNPLKYRPKMDSLSSVFRYQSDYYRNDITINQDYRVMTSNFINLVEGNTVNITYSNYKKHPGGYLPSIINIIMDANGQKSITKLQLVSVKTDPILSFPFKIPDRYERKIIQ